MQQIIAWDLTRNKKKSLKHSKLSATLYLFNHEIRNSKSTALLCMGLVAYVVHHE